MIRANWNIRVRSFLICVLFTSALASFAAAQDWTAWQGPQGGTRLRAQLRDKGQNAQNHMAAVEVEVQNAWLHYPNPVQQPGIQAAVLQYRLDSCPPILTTDTRLRFAELTSGDHIISVTLLSSDNKPISPTAKLQLNVP